MQEINPKVNPKVNPEINQNVTEKTSPEVVQEDTEFDYSRVKEVVIMKYLDYTTKSLGGDLNVAEQAGYLLNGYLTEKGYSLYDVASQKVYPKINVDTPSKELSTLDKLFKA